jgi:hypothetical protein
MVKNFAYSDISGKIKVVWHARELLDCANKNITSGGLVVYVIFFQHHFLHMKIIEFVLY